MKSTCGKATATVSLDKWGAVLRVRNLSTNEAVAFRGNYCTLCGAELYPKQTAEVNRIKDVK